MARPSPNPIVAHAFIWAPSWTEAHIRRAIERAAALGFDGIVIPMRDPQAIPAAELGGWCRAAGIQPYGASGGTPAADISSDDPAIVARGVERISTVIAKARDMGARQIGGVLYSALAKYPAPASAAGRRNAVVSLRRLAAEAKEAGIRLTLECVNRYETNLLNTAAQGVALLREIAAENLQLHLDTYHMNIEENDPAEAISAAAGAIGYFEFGESHRGHLGTGSVDLRASCRALARVGYAGPIGLEAFSAGVSEPAIGNVLAIWRDLFRDGDEFARRAKAIIDAEMQAAWSTIGAERTGAP